MNTNKLRSNTSPFIGHVRTTFVLLLAVVGHFCAGAQGVNFSENNIRQAFQLAKAQNKPVFIEVYSKTCSHCASFLPIFQDKKVADFFNQNFINYKIEVQSNDVRQFMTPRRLFAPSLPLFLFFDPNENLTHFAMSESKVDDIIGHGTTAMDAKNRASNYRNRYAAGDRNDNFLLELGMFGRVVCDTMLNIKAMESYAEKKPAASYTDNMNWLVLQKLIIDADNPMAAYMVANMGKYKTKYPAKDVKNVAENIIMSTIYSGRGAKFGADKIQRLRNDLVKIGVDSKSANARTLLPSVNAYFRTQKTAEAAKRADEYLGLSTVTLPDYTYVIKLFNDKATNASYAPYAIKWSNRALALIANKNTQDGADAYLELSEAYLRAGNKVEAKKAAQKALDAAKAATIDLKKFSEMLARVK